MSLFVRTGNNGTDPDFQINDLLGIIITSGPSWNELTSSNASNPTGGAGEFTSVELKDSEDLYNAIVGGNLEYSIDGYVASSNAYRADLPLILDFFDDTFDIRGGRLMLPTVPNIASVSNPVSGELIFSENDGYAVVYDGYAWKDLPFSSDITGELLNYFKLSDDEIVTGHTTFNTAVSTDPAFTITPNVSAPTTNVSDGSVAIIGGIQYNYDGSRLKWLSNERKFFIAGRSANRVRNAYLRIDSNVVSSNTGYRLLRNGTITGIWLQTRRIETWILQIRRNGTTTAIASLSVTASRGASNNALNVDVAQDDELQFYVNGTSVSHPVVGIEVAWRV